MGRYAKTQPPKRYSMILKINSVGVGRVKRYAELNHPNEDIKRGLEILRYAARHDYAECVSRFSISRQRAEQIVRRYYSYACEIESGEKAVTSE